MSSRVCAAGVAVIVALALGFATRAVRIGGWYAAHGAYRAQVEALAGGRLALSDVPEGVAHDLVWTGKGVHQVWGLGVPLWQLPFEEVGRLVGLSPFPDRVAMLAFLALVVFVLIRAWRSRTGEPWWIGAGSVLITALLPGVVTMMRGHIGAYEEAAVYAYAAAMILLGGLACFVHRPTRARYLLLLAAAGATGLIRPTVWFYGLATAIVATVIWLRDRRDRRDLGAALGATLVGATLFVAGGAALWTTNRVRFGSGTEFGHRLNLASLPGNLVATRFSYPFERVGFGEAAEELAGSLFDRPETRIHGHGFYQRGLHAGQSDLPRWREYYFTTYSWPYLPLLVAGLALGVRAWRRRDGGARWLVAWAVLGAGPLAVFYLHSPSMSSRYQLDLAPGFAALLVIAWQAAARWADARRGGAIAIVALAGAWGGAIATSRYYRPKIGSEPVDREAAAVSTYAIAHPFGYARTLPNAYDLADPRLPSYLDVVDHFQRCTDETGAPIACGACPLPGDRRLDGVRWMPPGKHPDLGPFGAWALSWSVVADEPPLCVPEDRICAAPPAVATSATYAGATEGSPPGLYLNGSGWDLDTGAVPPATYFFVTDPAYVELDLEGAFPPPLPRQSRGDHSRPATARRVARVDRDVEGEGEVRVAVGREHLRLVSAADTPRGRRLRFAGTHLPRGLAVVFVAFGSDEHLDRKESGMVLRRIQWRD